MIRTGLVAAAAAALLAGCGGGGHGQATVWVTRDEGKTVLLVRHVPAGETAMQALDRSAKIDTRYGGRFVESINGLSGSVSSRHDWFYFVNGIEATRGAVDYRLRNGDVEWWDYRDWGRVGQNVSGRGRSVSRAVLARVRREGAAGRRCRLGARGGSAREARARPRAAQAPSGANVLRLVARADALHGADAAERRRRVHVCGRRSRASRAIPRCTATGTRVR